MGASQHEILKWLIGVTDGPPDTELPLSHERLHSAEHDDSSNHHDQYMPTISALLPHRRIREQPHAFATAHEPLISTSLPHEKSHPFPFSPFEMNNFDAVGPEATQGPYPAQFHTINTIIHEPNQYQQLTQPTKSYERRQRRKTRPDRYTLKQHKPKEANTTSAQYPDLAGKGKKKKRSKRTQPPNAASLYERTKKNAAPDRLTLRPAYTAGLFGNGRTSSTIKPAFVPDYAFSEHRFLNTRCEKEQSQRVPRASGKARLDEVSQFFEQREPLDATQSQEPLSGRPQPTSATANAVFGTSLERHGHNDQFVHSAGMPRAQYDAPGCRDWNNQHQSMMPHDFQPDFQARPPLMAQSTNPQAIHPNQYTLGVKPDPPPFAATAHSLFQDNIYVRQNQSTLQQHSVGNMPGLIPRAWLPGSTMPFPYVRFGSHRRMTSGQCHATPTNLASPQPHHPLHGLDY